MDTETGVRPDARRGPHRRAFRGYGALRAASVIVALVAAAPLSARAIEAGGVTFAPTVRAVPSGGTLVLNGAGVRTRAIFKVFAIGLYVERTERVAERLIEQAGTKRVAIRMLRDVSASQFADALGDGIRANHDEAAVQRLAPRLAQLNAIMVELGEAREGMAVDLEWRPDSGTHVVIDGTMRGRPIPGEDFYRALLSIWLGANPVQSDLKRALLGRQN